MSQRGTQIPETVVSVGIFVALFMLSLVIFPVVGMTAQQLLPRWLSDALFFWPQMLLLPGGVASERYYIGYGVLVYVAILFWWLVAYAFARLTNRLTRSFRALLTYPVIIVMAVVVHTGLGLVGVHAMLEGL